ncbi:hypothetical protein BTUL_0013g00450 [Botrytis tulipae]|uniref:Uncharacterized protein n=1 Tax=Botrytis tulipae TaxID=87230 RepID=A0A4Z1F4X8_9HELO|nr:hypothetical protein BTUL_0013g00450 [Botrytis tulipae]
MSTIELSEKIGGLVWSIQSLKNVPATHNERFHPDSNFEILSFETEHQAWSLINKAFNLQADFPGVRPYIVHPTAAQSPEQRSQWEKKIGSDLKVTAERPDRKEGQNGAFVCLYLTINKPENNRKDNILMDIAYILNFLSRYKKTVSRYGVGKLGCPNLVQAWDNYMSSEKYPHSAEFKFPIVKPTEKKLTGQKNFIADRKLELRATSDQKRSEISRQQQHVQEHEKKAEEYDRIVEEEDKKLKEVEEEKAAEEAKKSELERLEAEKAAEEAKKAEERKEAEERKTALERSEAEKATEHPLIKNPLVKPDWIHQKTLSWVVLNYSDELPLDELMKVLRRDFGIYPKS